MFVPSARGATTLHDCVPVVSSWETEAAEEADDQALMRSTLGDKFSWSALYFWGVCSYVCSTATLVLCLPGQAALAVKQRGVVQILLATAVTLLVLNQQQPRRCK